MRCSKQALIAATVLALMPAHAAAFEAGELAGRWGLAAYFREADAAKVAAAAAAQCGAPYIIARGPNGGAMLHRPDETVPSEHSVRKSWSGKTSIGPLSDASGARDREVVSYNGNRLVLRWLDASVAGRYGTMVFVRCRR